MVNSDLKWTTFSTLFNDRKETAMAVRRKFIHCGITIEGEEHILEDLVNFVREAEHEGVEPTNTISDLIFAMEVEMGLNGQGPDYEEE